MRALENFNIIGELHFLVVNKNLKIISQHKKVNLVYAYQYY